MAAVYKIIGNQTNQFYIGSSVNAENRFKQHKKLLEKGTHTNKPMTEYYKKYGFDFSFEIIKDGLSREEAYDLENQYLQEHKNDSMMFNVSCNSKFGDTTTRQPNKEEYIRLRTERQLETTYSLTKEERDARWSRKGETNPNYRHGKFIPGVCPVCGVPISAGAKFCPHHVDKRGEKNSFFGKHHTEEFKRRRSIARTGKFYNPSNARPCMIDGVRYANLTAAHRALDIHIMTIRWRCNSKSFPNYKFIENE